jgi:hypothetical protein
MKNTLALLLSFSVLLGLANGPKYGSNESKEIIRKMIDAHGGYAKWEKKKTFSYDNIMFSEQLPGTPFWISKATIEKETRRVYMDWPIHQSTMTYDGEKAWSVDWKIGNPPKFEALFFYYFLNLPWLTQDDNVKISDAKRIKHAAFENEVYVLDMTFKEKPAVGKTAKDNYKLYVDSESYLLVGYEYSIGYGYMLDLFGFPEDKDLFGPMFRVNNSFTTVDGLVYPNLMQTSNLEQTQVYGYHSVINYSLNEPFDKKRLEQPSNAVIDTSTDKRK